MTSDSAKMRQVLNLLEISAREPTLLNEGWVDTIKSKLFGDKETPRSLGAKEHKELASLLYNQWETWLGQTNREGTLNDAVRFLTHRIGFKDEEADAVISKADILPKGEEPDASDDEAGEESHTDGPVMPKPGHEDDDGDITVPDDEDEKKVGESLTEREMSGDIDDEILSKEQVLNLMDLSSSLINDEYIYNGPHQDEVADTKDKAGIQKGALGKNTGRPMPRGQYDSNEANEMLDGLGVTKGIRASLTRKAKNAQSLEDFNRRDKEYLFMIGLALLRSRT